VNVIARSDDRATIMDMNVIARSDDRATIITVNVIEVGAMDVSGKTERSGVLART
jgi:hypothetical protein